MNLNHRFGDPFYHQPQPGFSTGASGWLEYLRGHTNHFGDEFDLTHLQPGDRLQVVTQRTTYTLTVLAGRDAKLETDRPDRPGGRVRIVGCSFGLSPSVKPDHLFCGGSLRFSFYGGGPVHTTTAIREIGWRRDVSA